MDEFDQAAEMEEAHRQAAIARVRSEATPAGFDGVHCAEPACGDEIPAQRLALGKFRCLACQQRKESNR